MKNKLVSISQDKTYRKYIVVLLTIVLSYLSLALYRWSNTQSTDNAYLKADLANVSIEISGVIKEVLVDSNKVVKQGEVIALLDDHDLKANLLKAEASLLASSKNIEVIDQRIILEKINQQKNQEALELAKTTFDLTTTDFKRVTRLSKDKFTSQKLLDDASINLEKSKSDYNQKMLSLNTNQQTIALLNLEKESETANWQVLEQSKVLAQRNWENTVIRSPIDGKMANSNLQVGNYVRPGSILFSVVPNIMYIDANFKETQIYKFRPGMIAWLKFDSLPNVNIEGRIRNISPATGATFSLIPPDNATGNFTKIVQRVPVRIDFTTPELDNFNLAPGMSVKVNIRTDQ